MKKPILFIIISIFIANTFVVSAWAQPCPMNDMKKMDMASIAQPSIDMASDIPCHDSEASSSISSNQSTLKVSTEHSDHCDDMCFCLHASISPVSIIGSVDVASLKIPSSASFSSINRFAPSRTISPPYRPPILIS